MLLMLFAVVNVRIHVSGSIKAPSSFVQFHSGEFIRSSAPAFVKVFTGRM